MAESMDLSGEIDEALYSRQLYVLGHEAMRKMGSSSVLIVGLDGLGVEIAKNVILAGVKVVTLFDQEEASFDDLASQFYLNEDDIGKTRSLACISKLVELNPYVRVNLIEQINDEILQNFKVVVICNRKLDEQLELSRRCRNFGVFVISGSTFGVFGQIFVDCGSGFIVTDTTGEEPVTRAIASITQDNPGLVTVVDDTRHELESGDKVTFSGIEGMDELNGCEPCTIQVTSPYSFTICDTTGMKPYLRQGYFHQVKQSASFDYLSMEESLQNPEFVLADYGKIDRSAILHIAFQALHEFWKTNGHLPSPANENHAEEVLEVAKKIRDATFTSDQAPIELDENIIRILAWQSQARISPMCAVIGGIISQEVLKASSSKFVPLKQWLYIDAVECLPESYLPSEEFVVEGSRYDGQIKAFGHSFQRKLQEQSYFLVGAGAIGCEILKIWAMMGLGTFSNAQIHITDMDIVEYSNLNRQFMFRQRHVQTRKADAAAAVTRDMNPNMNIQAYDKKVGPETTDFFSDDFWESLSGVCNALDNVQARLYIDNQCVFYEKPLLESGTLGTKGSTQIIVPHLTESYGSSRDPPEKSIPICTLKNFPYAIEHTLQWAKDKFESLFVIGPNEVNSYISDPNYIQRLSGSPNERMDSINHVKENLVLYRARTFEDCIHWARIQFEEFFSNTIKQLLFNFPIDTLTSSGTPFWSGSKKPPQPIEFDPNDHTHMMFVVAAANLRAYTFGLHGSKNEELFHRVLTTSEITPFVPRQGVKIAITEAEAEESNDSPDAEFDRVVEALPKQSSLAGYCLNISEFEKDDDTNHHMDFITAVSNLRARNYAIPESDKHKSKLIAGKIVPAIATTTALVSGLICLELYKLIQGKSKIEAYRNTFVNLALPLFAFSEPVEAPSREYRDFKWNLWSKISVQEDVTLQELMDFLQVPTSPQYLMSFFFLLLENIIKSEYGLEVSMLSSGTSILFSFFGNRNTMQQRRAMKMSELVSTVTKQVIPESTKYVVCEVMCMDSEGNDIQPPSIRIKIR